MRRAPIVLTTTAAGLAGVLSFHAREPSVPTLDASAAATTTPATPSTSGGSAAGSGSGSSGSSGSSSSSGTKTATGDPIDTRYGVAQVKVTVAGGKITDVQAISLQGNDPKSVQISSSAEPYLRQSALAKQTAAIDGVSGATITSASYEASLQSALDKLGFKAADGTRGSATIPEVEEHGGRDGDGGPGGPPDGFFDGP